ncbi:ATP-binding protein [Streptomyces sp. NBC_01237]|uniref:ATP-binding protein n=1 Tax=Streptomyces sp. NBC_01237 TaxID=2903790 RepID=UPI002DD80F19|nr:ATP-binding protein [Streptomyces sp. NBC_01237]WRZ77633.1 ATP-binding protein [Streptomyces sp. NBC_01237]
MDVKHDSKWNPATATVETAAATDPGPGPLASRAFEVVMSPDPVRVPQIRHVTAAVMRNWAVPIPLAQDVGLVVSELVTNAIEHGLGTVCLRVWQGPGELHVEVADDNPAPARLRAAGDEEESGRGLFLVADLARGWGVRDGGRTTWATLRAPSDIP